MKDYSEIKELLLKFSFLGIENSKSTGAMLIGRAPHIAENAWLNRLYSPIDKIEILKLEDGINKKIPASYVDFLTDFSNGLNILGDTLCLFGYRSNYMRTVDFSWQPYSLVSLNTIVMLHKFLNDFLALAPLQLPELINQERMEQPVYEDGYVLLDFKLEKPCPLEEVMNLFEDQMELVILYHKVTSVHTEFGQFCCAFSNPNFGRMYKMNASTDANGNVHSVMVTIYESLEFMYGDLCHDMELQARTGFFKYKRDKADMLMCFM